MPPIKLTERQVAKLRAPDPSGKQRLFWDDSLKGFAVLVSGVSSSKSYVVQRALPGGRTRRVTIAPVTVLKLDKARERAKTVIADFYKGIDPKVKLRGGIVLRDALEEFLRARTDLRPRSAAAYRESVERHLKPWLDHSLRTITREMVEDRLRKISAEVSRGRRHSGHAAANGAIRSFRAIYNYISDRTPEATPMPPNPVKLKKAWLPVEPRTRLITVADLPAFYKAVTALANTVARDYLLLLLFTGMRRREAAGLRWQENIDLRGKVIRLPASSTKSGKPLDLPMSDFVYDLLFTRRALGDAAFVFPAPSRSGHIEEPRHPLDLVRDTCGVYVSAHDLRRTFVTVAESCDISAFALRALVNHSLGRSVTEGYLQMTADRLREPAQRVCDKLKTLCGIAPIGGKNVKALR